MTPDLEGFVSVRTAAEYYDVIPLTIYRWIKAGRIPFVRLGTRTVRVKLTDENAGEKQAEFTGRKQAENAGGKQAPFAGGKQAKLTGTKRRQKTGRL